jgi:hypothetical protein
MIHEYFGVNRKILWKTVTEDLPLLRPLNPLFPQILQYSRNIVDKLNELKTDAYWLVGCLLDYSRQFMRLTVPSILHYSCFGWPCTASNEHLRAYFSR